MNLFSLLPIQRFGQTLQHVAPDAASLLIASVWRGALLALIVWAGLKSMPKLSAAVRSAIWLCVLAVVMVSPALSFFWHAPSVSGGATGLVHLDARWSYALFAVWGLCSLVRVIQLAISAAQLRKLASRAMTFTADHDTAAVLASTSRRVELCVSTEVDRPSVIGFFRPRILLPRDLLAHLSATELEQIVLHEMEHLRRHDDWTNLLQKISVALLPLHPVVLWLDRRLCLERELACDDGVVRATEARKSYAACLTNLAEHSLVRRGVSLALGAVGGWKPKSEVAKRVCRILAKPETMMSRTQTRFASGALLSGVLGGAVVLAHAPHLVSFTYESPQTTAAVQAPIGPGTPYASVSVNSMRATSRYVSAPHATFASAVSGKSSPRFVRTALTTTKRKRSATAQTTLHAAERVPQPYPIFRLAAWHDDDMPAPRLALAIQQDSQFTYAAVPVRGGWLIVQL